MPVQTKKSSLAAGLKKHAEAPIDYGQDYTNLPGDISDGVARLTSIKKGVYKSGPNSGKEFIRFEGTVLEPKTATDVKKVWEDGKVRVVSAKEMVTEGLFTSIMIPLCETNNKNNTNPVTQEEHEAEVANHLKKLGDPADWKPGESSCLDGLETDEDLEGLFTTLCDPENPIYFKFRTRLKEPSKDYPSSGTWDHNWDGKRGLEDYVPDTGGGVADSSPKTTPSTNGQAKAPAKPAATPARPAAKPSLAPEKTEAPDDLSALVALADQKHQEAIDRLGEIATSVGIGEDWVEKANSWEEVAEAIAAAQGSGGDAEPGDAQETQEPADIHYVGASLVWHHPDPKNSKKSLKTDIEVLTVNAKTDTATVKDLATGKPIMDKNKRPIAIALGDLKAE